MEEEGPKPEIVPKGRQFKKKLGELGAGPYENYFRPGRPPEIPEHSLIEFFQHSHVEAPEYNSSCKDFHPFAKGSMFLSVCVNELEQGWGSKQDQSINHFEDENGSKGKRQKQLYRIDIPLKCRKDIKSERVTMALLMNLGETINWSYTFPLDIPFTFFVNQHGIPRYSTSTFSSPFLCMI